MKKFTAAKPTIEMVIVKREMLSPKAFLEINKTNQGSIKSASFVPPRIGSKGFGGFDVEYRTPKLVAAYE
jgi:hypothetical protein